MKILVLVVDDAVDFAPIIAAVPSEGVLCGIEDTDPARAADSLKKWAEASQ